MLPIERQFFHFSFPTWAGGWLKNRRKLRFPAPSKFTSSLLRKVDSAGIGGPGGSSVEGDTRFDYTAPLWLTYEQVLLRHDKEGCPILVVGISFC